MILQGKNKLVLTQEAMCRALEDAINAAIKDGEDYIRVVEISHQYNWSDFEITITTDIPEVAHVEEA